MDADEEKEIRKKTIEYGIALCKDTECVHIPCVAYRGALVALYWVLGMKKKSHQPAPSAAAERGGMMEDG